MGLNVIIEPKKHMKKSAKLTIVILGIIGVVVLIPGIIMYSTISKHDLKIYPEVWVEDINLGGKTKDEAKKAIIQKHDDLTSKKNVIININKKEYNINMSKFNMKYDYDNIINLAYGVGRKDNIFKNYFAVKSPEKKNFKLNHTYNYEIINTVLKQIVKDNNTKITNANIIRNSLGQLVVTKEAYGYEVNSKELVQAIKNKVSNIEKEKDLVIKSELKKIEPKIKENDLVGINTKISSATTNFRTSSENRSTNIRIASNAINGKLLMPGEVFSFNDVVGERSRAQGYKIAKGIVNDKVVDDLGGGVCQVSTTLYNAILKTEMVSVERYHHSLPSAYIGPGLDATVAYGLLDYRFRNTHNYPVYIEAKVQNKNVTFDVYSNSIINNKKYNIINEMVGEKVKVSRIIYENGKLLSKKILYTEIISRKKS